MLGYRPSLVPAALDNWLYRPGHPEEPWWLSAWSVASMALKKTSYDDEHMV
jgi:hypothetical protein